MAHRLSCPTACGVFPDKGLNPCLLYWQADSLPLSHQGSPLVMFWNTWVPVRMARWPDVHRHTTASWWGRICWNALILCVVSLSSQSIEEEDTLPFCLQIQAVMRLVHLSPWDLGHVVFPRASACGYLHSCSCWPGQTPQPSSFQLLGFPHPGRRQREDHLEAHLSDIDLSLIHKDFP